MATQATQLGSIRTGTPLRPSPTVDYRAKSSLRSLGLGVAVVGLMVAMAAFIGSLIQAGLIAGTGIEGQIREYEAWTFGVATAGPGILKFAIALILLGIVRRLWVRVESVKAGLPRLVPDTPDKAQIASPGINTPYGRATVTAKTPPALLIHRMAYAMWAPMLIMGAMVVGLGLVLSFVEASAANAGRTGDFLRLSALTQGIEFFGEALILSGISFVLGSILGSLRQGAGEVQESLGVAVKIPVMPTLAKAFVALMMMGLMLAMVQLALYVYVASLSNPATIAAFFAWLGPLREISLGLILSGIVLALATIGTKLLPFQFWRIQELIAHGK